MKFSVNILLMVILKVTRRKSSTLSSEDKFWKNHSPQVFLGLTITLCLLFYSYAIADVGLENIFGNSKQKLQI